MTVDVDRLVEILRETDTWRTDDFPASRSAYVELTDRELEIAHFVAEKRNAHGKSAGANATKFGYSGSTLELHYRGCLGEMAFAKGMDRYWSGAGQSFHDDDDVGNVQVRVTAHEQGCLIVRPEEKAEDLPWVLVVGSGSRYRLAGWLWGRETRRGEWLRAPADRPPAYFVPQKFLRPCL